MKTLPPTRLTPALLLALASLGLAHCGDDAGLADGTLQVTVFGGDFVEDRIPAASVADGWSIDFARFLVAVSDVSLGKSGKTATLFAGEARVFDLTKPSNGQGHLLGSADAPGGVYDRASFSIAPAGGDAIPGNATQADTTFMVQGGLALYVEGTAQKGGQSKHFAWSFTSATAYTGCPVEARVDGGTGTAQVSLHAERLFRKTLDDSNLDLAFQAMADADADADDEVTQAEVGAVALSGLTGYVGTSGVSTLGALIAAQVERFGAVDGNVACGVAP